MSKSSPWVVIGSANGSGNLGDEAMWHASVATLRELVGPVDVVTDTPNYWGADGVDSVRELPYLYTTLIRGGYLQRANSAFVKLVGRAVGRVGRWATAQSRYKAALVRPRTQLQKEWFNTITSSSGVIFSGAGAITDRYAINGVYAWSLIAQWAKGAGIPVAYLGQGLGPLSPLHVPAASAGLGNADFVGVRDPRSLEVARSWGVESAKVQPDWATLAVPSDEDRRRAAVCQPGAPFIAVCLHTITAEQNDTNLTRALTTVIDFAATNELRVLLVPNMRGGGANDDEKTMRRLLSRLSPEAQALAAVVTDSLNARETRALLGRAQFVVASRYHTLVFAGAEGRWTVGIAIDDYWQQKLRGAQTSADQRELVVTASAPSADLSDALDTAFKESGINSRVGIDGTEARNDLEAFLQERARLR